MPSITRTLRMLTDELCGDKKSSERQEWSIAMETALEAAKQALLSATHLAHLTVGAYLSLGSGRGYLGNTHGCMPPAAATWLEELAAPGILLKEARVRPAEVLCV